MPITVAEFQENISHYLNMLSQEDIFIMRDGEVIAKLTQPYQNKVSRKANLPKKLTKRTNSKEIEDAINSLVGALPDDGMTLSDYRAERLAKYENFA